MLNKCKTIVELEVDVPAVFHQLTAALHNLQDYKALLQLHIFLSRVALIDRSAVEQIVEDVQVAAELDDDLTSESDEETKAMRELGLPVRFVASESRIKRAEAQSRRQKLRANRGKPDAKNKTRHKPTKQDSDLIDEELNKDDDADDYDPSDDAYWQSLRTAFDRAYSDLEHDADMPLGETISKRCLVAAWGEAVWHVLGAYLSSATWLWLYAKLMTAEDRRAQARQLDADRATLCAVLQSAVENESESENESGSLRASNEASDTSTCTSTEYWNSVWQRHCECVRAYCLSLEQPTDFTTFEVDQLDGINDCGRDSDDGESQPAAPDSTSTLPTVGSAEAIEHANGAAMSRLKAAERRRMRVAKSAQLWTNVAKQNAKANPLKRDGESTFDKVLHSLGSQTVETAKVQTDSSFVKEDKFCAPKIDATRVKSTFRQLGFVWHGATAEPQRSDCEGQTNVDCEFDSLLSNIRSFKCRSKQLAKARKLGLGRSESSVDPVPQANVNVNVNVNADADADGERKRKKVTEKYRAQRYRLFSRFDCGVQLDDESWWSVTPEQIARHHAERCACDVIVDACCGVGGNAIQFARTCSRVLAFDIDVQRLHMARHNSRLYDDQDAIGAACSSKVELVCGDFVQFVKTARVSNAVDVVFLDLPWGGPQYLQSGVFDLENMRLETVEDGRRVHLTVADLFQMVAQRITSSIAVFAPRNCNMQQLVALARFTDGKVELEQNLLNGKLKTVTAYYGALVKS